MSNRHEAFLTAEGERSLIELGRHIQIARKRRRWTQAGLAHRSGVGEATIGRLEKGQGSVGLAVLVNVLIALDLEHTLRCVADPQTDQVGLGEANRQLPKRVRPGGEDELDTDF